MAQPRQLAINRKTSLYGMAWEPLMSPVSIEATMIRRGGRWKKSNGEYAGEGLFFHFKKFISLVWPEHVWHKWSALTLETLLNNRIIGIMGPASSGKSHDVALYILADFYVWPDCTTILVSSTEREMLEMRIWGECKRWHQMAKERFPQLIPGNLIESRQRLITDSRFENADGRDFRNGICGIPLKRSGSYQGLGSMIGIKNSRVRMVCDEAHLCPRVFVDAFSNLGKNQDFKGIALGNPKDTTDALGVVCEPSAELGGWDGGIDQGPKTKTWPTRFKDGICLQLRGDDCPNMDVPASDPVPYPFLITRKAMADDVAFYGASSLAYTMMNLGIMPRGQGLRRVITRQMCLKFGAMEEAIWKDERQTKVAFCDPAYGAIGGDRAVWGWMKFGMDPNGKQILALMETTVIPVSALENELPEDQIANFVKAQCEQLQIPPQNFFFDSTGRGSLVGAFARLWSPNIGLIEFGGKPTERLVSTDVRVTCRDHYFNFVSELWFSLALTIQAGQFRGMTEDIMTEGAMREWGFTGANKIQVEPKEKMKIKSGRSPDLVDAVVCGVEGARRLGFLITRTVAPTVATKDDGWKLDFKKRMERLESNHRLNYSV
jgi:hypothetical protein